jgi:hypothetical protein
MIGRKRKRNSAKERQKGRPNIADIAVIAVIANIANPLSALFPALCPPMAQLLLPISQHVFNHNRFYAAQAVQKRRKSPYGVGTFLCK